MCTEAVVICKVAILYAYVNIARNIVSAVNIAMDEDGFVAILD